MAGRAVLHILGMLKGIGPLLVRMALDADLFHCRLFKVFLYFRAMRFMTANAENLLFMNRMVAGEGKFCFGLEMAFLAEIFHLFLPDDQVRPHMYFMTVGAGDIVDRMHAGIPGVEIEILIFGMTFQADQGLGRCRELCDLNKHLIPAFCLFPVPCILLNLFAG